jgi:putative tryptophan/tyrosine transport system substrate-binding protein
MRRRDFIKVVFGSAITSPLVARAEEKGKIPKVGVLWHAGSAEEEGPNFTALIEGFKALGYVDGQNIRLLHRFPNEVPDKFRSMAAELVAAKVDVLVSVGVSAAPHAKNATTTIPVVMTIAPDPVASKLVDSLAKPGGNVTGITIFGEELAAKRLQLLKEAIPSLSRVALLLDPDNAQVFGTYVKTSQLAADKLGLGFETFEARSVDELGPAFEKMSLAGMQAVSVTATSMFYQGRFEIAKLGLWHHLPAIVWSRETVEPGSLMSYGPDVLAVVRRAAVYVDKILKGATPAELPVEEPTRVQLILNLKTAKALGIEFPASMLDNADELIE